MFSSIPIKISMTFITKIEKSTLKFIWKCKRQWRAKAILYKKSNTEGITIFDFKVFYRTIAIKKSMVLAQKQVWKPVEQNRRARYKSMQLCPPDFWQRCQKDMMRKESLLNKFCWKLVSPCRKLKLDSCLS
jgi:hypothetical protein